jgi:hypothetical protein
MSIRMLLAGAFIVASWASPPPVLAQQAETRMEAGLRIAMRRGAHDPQCYAAVFARHARWGIRRDGTPGWRVDGSPAYNSEMRRVCDINRGGLVRAERRANRRFGGGPVRGADPSAMPF